MNKTRKQVKRKRSVIKTLAKKLMQNLFFVRRSQMKNIPSGGSIKAMKSVLCREIVLLSYKHLKLQMRLKIRGLDGNHSSFETRTLNGDFSLTPSLNLACIFFSLPLQIVIIYMATQNVVNLNQSYFPMYLTETLHFRKVR